MNNESQWIYRGDRIYHIYTAHTHGIYRRYWTICNNKLHVT